MSSPSSLVVRAPLYSSLSLPHSLSLSLSRSCLSFRSLLEQETYFGFASPLLMSKHVRMRTRAQVTHAHTHVRFPCVIVNVLPIQTQRTGVLPFACCIVLLPVQRAKTHTHTRTCTHKFTQTHTHTHTHTKTHTHTHTHKITHIHRFAQTYTPTHTSTTQSDVFPGYRFFLCLVSAPTHLSLSLTFSISLALSPLLCLSPWSLSLWLGLRACVCACV